MINSYSVAYEERFVVIHVPCLTSTIMPGMRWIFNIVVYNPNKFLHMYKSPEHFIHELTALKVIVILVKVYKSTKYHVPTVGKESNNLSVSLRGCSRDLQKLDKNQSAILFNRKLVSLIFVCNLSCFLESFVLFYYLALRQRDHWKEDKLTSHYPVIMPGYKLANCDEAEIDKKYFCCVCGLLLRDVMQTYCGHLYCFSCLGNLSVPS
ncbi:PREDICTED: uncharacterized protein LOC107343713 [Acropora digitifera]|uniref:uncharacterized protein LOC107343713 n=1 Tax=Acropora digitifera TaxID=70779 RepID=UPI00077A27AC|nr:PREDICTED: uncharacterized protein LOC107343713 [Acropora digitifera]